MKILDRIEGMFESVFEGIFAKRHIRTQPVEIGKKLLKAMEAHSRVSIAKTYAPNIYAIKLNPDHLGELESLQRTLIRELKGFLLQKAEEKKLSFIGDLDIAFVSSPDLGPGSIEIEASFLESNHSSTGKLTAKAPVSSNPEQTQVFAAQSEAKGLPSLHVYGESQEMTYQVVPQRQSIGRSLQCDLVLKDLNASRVHAWLEPFSGKWRLVDNNSTNGTYLNNRRISEQVLNDGDQIRVGTTILIFREGEG
ncbi:MAG: DUF3662 domain-containing protein [Firmicutes bacterium]|jgi:hypothetical protein|nr:DUF3662 and FHA domain-containing protein [Bacillota bacterium]NLL88150.1 DUF3662 domain-containing protein [Bacillota bacterium]HKM16847.1 DUF3662 and FHA domain-containing protein [Limnochordia bacterium]